MEKKDGGDDGVTRFGGGRKVPNDTVLDHRDEEGRNGEKLDETSVILENFIYSVIQ